MVNCAIENALSFPEQEAGASGLDAPQRYKSVVKKYPVKQKRENIALSPKNT